MATKEVKKTAPPAANLAAPAKVIQHGITKPRSGKTLEVWDIADKLSAKSKKPVSRKELLEATGAADINGATAATQYGKWRTFHGLGKEEAGENKPEPTVGKAKKQAPVEAVPDAEEAEEAEEAEGDAE
jgi:hypothetical protein